MFCWALFAKIVRFISTANYCIIKNVFDTKTIRSKTDIYRELLCYALYFDRK